MTISPPSNVRLDPGEPARVLATGIDALTLSLYVDWTGSEFLDKLRDYKVEAEANHRPTSGVIKFPDGSGAWLFEVHASGVEGFAYRMEGQGFSWVVGRNATPIQRPSVRVTVRSETLWHQGVDACIQRTHAIVLAAGGVVTQELVGRLDVCVDVLLPVSQWRRELADHVVTRAGHDAAYGLRRKFTGFQFGKGGVVARLYDKAYEIAEKSGKFWMFDIWGIDELPDDHRLIRIEYELKREALKSLGLETSTDALRCLPQLWRTLTGDWLRIVDDASKHSARQKSMAWWKVVQAAVPGAQGAEPMVRAKAVRNDLATLGQQILGSLTSVVAILRGGDLIAKDEFLDLVSHLPMVLDVLKRSGWDDALFTQKVKEKQVKRMRQAAKFQQAVAARAALGLSSNPVAKCRSSRAS